MAEKHRDTSNAGSLRTTQHEPITTHINFNAPDSLRTAYREAAHAVLAQYLSIPLDHVTIDADHKSAGHVTAGGEEDPDAQELLSGVPEAFAQLKAMILYAGAEAQQRLEPESDWREHAAEDYYQAAMWLEKMTLDPECLQALEIYTKRRAQLMVEYYWPEIQWVAYRLLEVRTLAGYEVKAITAALFEERMKATYAHGMPFSLQVK